MVPCQYTLFISCAKVRLPFLLLCFIDISPSLAIIPACGINYHHNFQVSNGEHIYYGGVPDILQVGEHQFVEKKVVEMWMLLMDTWYDPFLSMVLVITLFFFSGFLRRPVPIYLQSLSFAVEGSPSRLASELCSLT